ncbi:hypothetical protein MNBD_BACTEROID06-839 [hydrothermal vent metagenome]|uniref:Uncharacterized protein n=1 Tax=hydrothermal vent metagenome TaxID=652676 RepID=A0A3B0V1F4_9ZZZZ
MDTAYNQTSRMINMKTQYTFTWVTRSILVLTSLAGLVLLMFFKDTSPLINWLALASIIPLIMGMLGENLVREFFVTTIYTRIEKDTLRHKTVAPVMTNLPLHSA